MTELFRKTIELPSDTTALINAEVTAGGNEQLKLTIEIKNGEKVTTFSRSYELGDHWTACIMQYAYRPASPELQETCVITLTAHGVAVFNTDSLREPLHVELVANCNVEEIGK